jgi:recombinational DNA repair protein (RecF pathway)
MPALTTEGIILKRKNFGEADRVLTVLTNRFGKISVIARGVRRITSRRAGNIEVLNRTKLHLFKGKGYTLTEAESLNTFQKVKDNLTLSTTAFHIVELIDRLTAEGQPNPHLYDMTLAVLNILEKNPRQVFIRAYETKLLTLLGFWSIDRVKDVNPEIKTLLKKLEDSTWEEIEDIELDASQASALEQVLRYYIEKVLESNLKSVKVLEQLRKER